MAFFASRTLHPDPRRGFTLIELLVSIGVMAVIFALGLFIDARFYRRANLDAERDTVVSLLVRARSYAVNNVDRKGHGFSIASSSYVVFEGSSYAARNPALDESFSIGADIVPGGAGEIDFAPLDASVAATGTITLANETRTLAISINQEGMINW